MHNKRKGMLYSKQNTMYIKIIADKNKVYYGEYTLKHWIDLILTGDLILPKYQRFFKWDKDKSKALVKALVENQFVPPVRIGNRS